MLVVNSECEDTSLFSPIQLKWINEYESRRFKRLNFIYYNETIIDDLLQFYCRRK